MNLGDPELELIDPTPNVHVLFMHFDKLFFWTKLASRAVVRWSKRMYSCAGICSYDRGGLCDIALSEPLLKLRPRKDLIETLLHEMIHAFLFITNRDRDRDGHGPNFKAHMHRINSCAGLNISIYHDFHEEVRLYQTHWWRCDGPCQSKRPHFGIVRRNVNRAPGPTDYWWKNHIMSCGGTFVKIKEPEKQYKKSNSTKSTKSTKPNADITKYINKTENNKTLGDKSGKPILKDSSNTHIKTINSINSINTNNTINTNKSNNSNIVGTKKNIVLNPQSLRTSTPFSGTGYTLNVNKTSPKANVTETVRNVWVNKQPTINCNEKVHNRNTLSNKRSSSDNLNKNKVDTIAITSPPMKIMKIDNYFKTSAKAILKDIYGKDFDIKEIKSNTEKRLSVVSVEPVTSELVDCPICNTKVDKLNINKHLDECLNKDVLEELSKEEKSPSLKITTAIEENIPSTSKSLKSFPNNSFSKEITKNNEPNIALNLNAKTEPNTHIDTLKPHNVKVESGESELKCPCCGNNIDETVEEHLDECLTLFSDNTTIQEEGNSKVMNNVIVIDDDEDKFDESLTLNATGTKLPCPCCLKMTEEAEMNNHLDVCLK